MKTSIFVIVLIVVVCMAGALMLSIVYQKRAPQQKTGSTVSEHFTLSKVAYAINEEYPAEPRKVTYKPIVMDLGLSNPYPF